MVTKFAFLWLVAEIAFLSQLALVAAQTTQQTTQQSTQSSSTQGGGSTQTTTTSECPFSPCVQFDTLTATDVLEIGVYYDILWYRNTPQKLLVDALCQILTDFEANVTAAFKPGAAVTVEEDGSAGCGDFCNNDRKEACSIKLDEVYYTSCSSGDVAVQDYNVCLATNGGDDLLMSNGQERETLGIPVCRLPVLTFNGVYDPCGVFTTYDEILAYVCSIFGQTLDGCSS